jgi:hypothetical protein
LKKGGKSVAENVIKQLLEELFPKAEIICNTPLDEFRSPKSNRPLGFDLYIPSLRFAIEIQGPQHFEGRADWSNNQKVLETDEIKRCWCEKQGVKLIWMDWKRLTELFRLTKPEQAVHVGALLLKFLQSRHNFMFWRSMDTQEFE